MSYYYYKAKDINYIREQEIGIAQKIKFSKMTTCIGVIAQVGKELWAAHLPFMGGPRNTPDGQAKPAAFITTYDVENLRSIFPDKLDKVYIVGWLTVWANAHEGKNGKNWNAAFQKLGTVFTDSSGDVDFSCDSSERPGGWGAEINSKPEFIADIKPIDNVTYTNRILGMHDPRTAIIR
jgi:hypothetical protein